MFTRNSPVLRNNFPYSSGMELCTLCIALFSSYASTTPCSIPFLLLATRSSSRWLSLLVVGHWILKMDSYRNWVLLYRRTVCRQASIYDQQLRELVDKRLCLWQIFTSAPATLRLRAKYYSAAISKGLAAIGSTAQKSELRAQFLNWIILLRAFPLITPSFA